MRYTFLLAWRHLAHHRWQSIVLAFGIAMTVLLPLSVELLVDRFSTALSARAESTPLVCGAKGSRYDLVLSTLYFEGRVPNPLTMAEVARIEKSGFALPIPILARHEAKGRPIVGTTHDYYGFRGLVVAEGTAPVFLGDATLGATVASELGLGPGDSLLSDQENLYDLSKGYPLKMRVAGVLAESGGPDDGAVFVDLKTAWIIEGIGHGHVAAEQQGNDQVFERTEDGITLNASVREFAEITPDNVAGFHFHAAPDELPLTGIVVVPGSRAAATKLKGRFIGSESAQLLVPTEVMDELLGFVFRVKRFFDANAVLVSIATGFFLAVIVTLSLQVRRREMRTLFKIGCAQRTVARLLGTELAVLAVGGLLLAAAGAAILLQVARGWSDVL